VSAARERRSGPAERFFTSGCGRVKVTAPEPPDRYWRLEWTEHGRRRQTTGGRTRADAEAKVRTVQQRLDAGAVPGDRQRIEAALEAYIEFSKGNHQPNHTAKVEPDLRKAFAPYLRVRCADLARTHLRDAVQAASTRSAGQHRRSRISAFVKWGYRAECFTEAQTHLVDHVAWTAPKGAPPRPTRDFSPPPTGESERSSPPTRSPATTPSTASATPSGNCWPTAS
jgi:hypothetical protein